MRANFVGQDYKRSALASVAETRQHRATMHFAQIFQNSMRCKAPYRALYGNVRFASIYIRVYVTREELAISFWKFCFSDDTFRARITSNDNDFGAFSLLERFIYIIWLPMRRVEYMEGTYLMWLTIFIFVNRFLKYFRHFL